MLLVEKTQHENTDLCFYFKVRYGSGNDVELEETLARKSGTQFKT